MYLYDGWEIPIDSNTGEDLAHIYYEEASFYIYPHNNIGMDFLIPRNWDVIAIPGKPKSNRTIKLV